MSATTGRWKTYFKKLESWVPKEREAIHSCLMNFIGKMNGSMKIVNQNQFRKVVAML